VRSGSHVADIWRLLGENVDEEECIGLLSVLPAPWHKASPPVIVAAGVDVPGTCAATACLLELMRFVGKQETATASATLGNLLACHTILLRGHVRAAKASPLFRDGALVGKVPAKARRTGAMRTEAVLGWEALSAW